MSTRTRTFFMVDLGILVVSLAIAGLIWWLLRSWPAEGPGRGIGE